MDSREIAAARSQGVHVAQHVLLAAAVIGPLVLLGYALTAPALVGLSPHASRIIYFHVPLAILAYAAFATTLVASASFLVTAARAWDRVAVASAEVGVLFSVIVIATGLAWAQADFVGYQPLEDPKLVSVIALAVVYLGYLLLRGSVTETERRARLASVFGLVAFLAVPVAYFATDLGSVHPLPTQVEGVGAGLGFGLLLMAPLALYLIWCRCDTLALESEIEDLKNRQKARSGQAEVLSEGLQ
ncbi:MAG: cytochrome c biogenesis protein [Thermoplasmatota archaeon]